MSHWCLVRTGEAMGGPNGNDRGRNGANGNGGLPAVDRHPALGGTMAMLRRHGAAFLRQQAGGRPQILEIEVTRRCNARCAWCNAWRAPGNEPEAADYAALVRRIHPLDVALVGGEPLLRPDLERLVASLRLATEVSAIVVLTNGIDLTIDRARRLHEAGVDKLVLGIEGLGAENDRARRRPGLFAAIDDVLPRLVQVGFRTVQLQFTVTGRNVEQLVDAARFARERGVRIAYTLEGPTRLEARSGVRDDDELDRLHDVLEQVIDLADRWSHVVSSPEYLRGITSFLRGDTAGFPPCAAGASFLRATPDGWLRPCGSLPPVGHWTGFPFRPAPLDCPGCWSRLRGETPAMLGVSRLVELWSTAQRAGDDGREE
jgi:MoaA/NifB/PqqE/SkfB family radical SAM enzyme